MLNLKSLDMREGRIVFNRYKTARHHSMKAEPEALALIEKYAGKAPGSHHGRQEGAVYPSDQQRTVQDKRYGE